jgi:uncharacterized protein (DUF2062 family)
LSAGRDDSDGSSVDAAASVVPNAVGWTVASMPLGFDDLTVAIAITTVATTATIATTATTTTTNP